MAKDVELQQLHASPRSSARPSQFQYVNQLRKLYARRRYCELSACALGFLGILLMLAENEILMNTSYEDGNVGSISVTRETGLVVLKAVTSVTTVVLLALILTQYATRTAIHKMQNTIPPSTNFFTAQYRMILLELLVCSFHIPPGIRGGVKMRQFHSSLSQAGLTSCPTTLSYDLVQDGDNCYLAYGYPVEAFGVFMVVRLYLFGRYLRSSSALYSQWVAFVGSLNDINAMKPFFHFKALFKIRPLHLLVPLTLLNMLLTAAIIRILEHPVQASFANYWKSVWLTAVTITATGFGDYYPVTFLGRAVTIVSAMFGGVLLIALVQSLFFGVLELSPRELKVKSLIYLDSWEKDTHQNAATVIQTAWQWHRSGHNREALKLFAVMRTARELRSSKPEMVLSLDEQVAEMEQTVIGRMRQMEEEEAKILERIQDKARQLSQLKAVLQTRRQ